MEVAVRCTKLSGPRARPVSPRDGRLEQPASRCRMEFYPTRDQVPAEKAGTDYTKLRKSPRKFDQSQMGYECYSMECRMPLQDIPQYMHLPIP